VSPLGAGRPTFATGGLVGGAQALVNAGHAAAPAPKTPSTGSAPVMPPPGTYDPIIDSQVRAGARGVNDLQASNILADSRANQDYASSKEQVDTTTGWTLADLLTNRDRGLQDLGTSRDRTLADNSTARTRTNEDYGTATSNLARSYANLGMAQGGAAAAHGLVGSGVQTSAIQAAHAARAANQGRDQSQLDTTHNRTLADLLTSDTRTNEDYATGSGRLNQDYNTGVGRANQQQTWQDSALATELQRGIDDRSIALGTAQREQNIYGQDASAEAMYQATTSGLYTPPAPKGKTSTRSSSTKKKPGTKFSI
jgi:hypothetical protein